MSAFLSVWEQCFKSALKTYLVVGNDEKIIQNFKCLFLVSWYFCHFCLKLRFSTSAAYCGAWYVDSAFTQPNPSAVCQVYQFCTKVFSYTSVQTLHYLTNSLWSYLAPCYGQEWVLFLEEMNSFYFWKKMKTWMMTWTKPLLYWFG